MMNTMRDKALIATRKDLEEIIDVMYDNPDPKVQRKIAKDFPNGKPTAEEFIASLASQIRKRAKRLPSYRHHEKKITIAVQEDKPTTEKE